MDFALTADQQAIVEMTRGFAADRIAPFAVQWDADKHFPVDVLAEVGALGLGGIRLQLCQGPQQQLAAAAAARFGQQARDMAFDGARAEHELGGNAAVAAATAHQLQHPIFGGCDRCQQPGGRGRRRSG